MFFIVYLTLHFFVGILSRVYDLEVVPQYCFVVSIPASFYFWYHGDMNGLETIPGICLQWILIFYGYITCDFATKRLV